MIKMTQEQLDWLEQRYPGINRTIAFFRSSNAASLFPLRLNRYCECASGDRRPYHLPGRGNYEIQTDPEWTQAGKIFLQSMSKFLFTGYE